MNPELIKNELPQPGEDIKPQQPDVPVDGGAEADAAFRDCLCEVLRFTDRQINGLVLDGYEKASDLTYWGYDEITNWVNLKEKIHLNRDGASYGDMKRKGLIGLAWKRSGWVFPLNWQFLMTRHVVWLL